MASRRQGVAFYQHRLPGAADDEANKKIAAERKAQKYRARVYEKFPIRNWDKWVEDTQAHLFIQERSPARSQRSARRNEAGY
jgi:hypothetical protein